MTGPGEGGGGEVARGRNVGDAGDRADPRSEVGRGVLDTHIAWRSLVVSGLTAFAVVFCAAASEALFDMGHAAMAGASWVVCFACSYPFCRFVHARAVRPPLPAYFGETRLALLLVACCLLDWRDPSLAHSAYLALCLSLMLGGCADAFWLAAVAGRHGVGLRQAAVLSARFERGTRNGVEQCGGGIPRVTERVRAAFRSWGGSWVGEPGKEREDQDCGEGKRGEGGLMGVEKVGDGRDDRSDEHHTGDNGDELECEKVVGRGCLDTDLAWRSLLSSGLAASAVAGFALGSEGQFTAGDAAVATASYIVLFGLAYPLLRCLRKFATRPPLPAYFGEGRLALLTIAVILVLPGESAVASAGYAALCVCLPIGAPADAFWLSEVAGRRGVGLRQALVLAGRLERRRPGGVDR